MINGWKTTVVSLLIVIFGALEAYDFTQVLNEANAGYAATGIGVLMFILRALTKTPIFEKDV